MPIEPRRETPKLPSKHTSTRETDEGAQFGGVDRLVRAGINVGTRYPVATGVVTVVVVIAAGLAFVVRAYELAALTGPAWPLGGAGLATVAVVIWLNGALRHDYRLTRIEWLLVLLGQLVSLVALFAVLSSAIRPEFQAASAGYLAAFLLVLAPGLIAGNRRVRRDPAASLTGTIHAVDALAGRRRRASSRTKS